MIRTAWTRMSRLVGKPGRSGKAGRSDGRGVPGTAAGAPEGAVPASMSPDPPHRRKRGPLPPGKAGLLGIEISRGGLRFVELGKAGGQPVLRTHGEVAYGSTEDLASVLSLIVEENGIEAKDVHLVDSTCRANLRIHPMPDIPDSDLDAIVQGEIFSEAELLGESLTGDWCRFRRRGAEAEILVGQIPVADRTALAVACAQAGLKLQVLTSSSVVLAHHLLAIGEVPEGETIGLLDIGRSKTNMALLTHESVCLVREVYQGVTGSFLREAPAESEEVDLDLIGAGLDEIVGTVQQIRRTWQQYQGQNPEASLHHMVMTGETTRISQLIGLLQHDLRVPVRTWDPAADLDPSSLPDGFQEVSAAFAVPWVLATTPAADIALNFAEGVPDLRPVKSARIVVGATIAGMIAVGALQGVERHRLTDRSAALATMEATKAELEVELGLLEEVRVLWDQWLGGQMQTVGVSPADLRPYLAEVVAALPSDLRLTRVAFRPRGNLWRMEADAIASLSGARESHALMERFVNAMEISPLVAEVAMKPLSYERTRGRRNDSRFEFTIVADLHEAVAPAAPPEPSPDAVEVLP